MILKKGAEADLILERWHGRTIVVKKRIKKGYRIPEVDVDLRTSRTVRESRLLREAKLAGVPTPTVYMVDLPRASIVMQYISGTMVKQAIATMGEEERKKLCNRIGRLIGRLHKSKIAHGDLTTSNMILTPKGEVYFIDFGLGGYIKSIEDEGVDLHLMERALQSTHYRFAKEAFELIMEGYEEEVGKEKSSEVIKRVREIERRARYVER